jgi:hypothetical protein
MTSVSASPTASTLKKRELFPLIEETIQEDLQTLGDRLRDPTPVSMRHRLAAAGTRRPALPGQITSLVGRPTRPGFGERDADETGSRPTGTGVIGVSRHGPRTTPPGGAGGVALSVLERESVVQGASRRAALRCHLAARAGVGASSADDRERGCRRCNTKTAGGRLDV